jgi:hypothetical protein
VGGAGVVTAIQSGAPYNSTGSSQDFTTDENADLAVRINTSTNAYTLFNTTATPIGSSSCPGVSSTASGPYSVATDGTLFAAFENGTGPAYGSSIASFMQFITVSSGAPSGDCSKIVFSPTWGILPGSTAGTTYLLPGEPLPNTSTPVSTMADEFLAVSNGVVYMSAQQTLRATQGSYSGIFTVRTSGGYPVNGQYPAPPLVKVISNYDSVPGITQGLATCPGGVSQIPVISASFAVSSNYLVFTETQQLQDCTTMAISFAGGLYAYNLTTHAIQPVSNYGSAVTSGEPIVSGLSVATAGSLSTDGHLTFVAGYSNASTATTTQVLYSTYLYQVVTAVSLTAPATATYAGSVSLTAKVSPNTDAANGAPATGSIKFVDGTTVLGTQAIDSSGSATISVSSLGAGAHTLQAFYAGDALYEGASSATSSLTISKATPTLTLSSSSTSAPTGQAIVLTALAAGATGYPTGQIVFTAGTTMLGTSTVGSTGSATLTLSTLPVGTTSVIAIYAGDANFTAATGAALAITVGTPDYSVAASPTSTTITAGQSATFVFTVTPAFGFNAAVTFSCGTLPSEASCTFAPAAVTPSTGPVTSTLTITTTAQKVSSNASPSGLFHAGGVAVVGFAALLAWLPKRLRQRHRWTVFVFLGLLSAGVLSVSGCSGGSSPSQVTDPGTTKGTAAVTVSASAGSGSGATSHIASITVVIQ